MTTPDDTAVALARLRAHRTASMPSAARAAASRRIGRLGRRLVDVGGGETVLAWDDGAVPEADDTWSTHRLAPVAVRTLAVCLALCWPDPTEDPFPGGATTVEQVTAAFVAHGVDTRHGRGALAGELAVAGLVTLDGDTVRLGPAVASWSPGQILALRRLHPRLPRAGADADADTDASDAPEASSTPASDGEDEL